MNIKGVYVVAYYEGRFSYRFEPVNSTTVYADRELFSYPSESEAVQAVLLLEMGFELGYRSGYEQCEVDTTV